MHGEIVRTFGVIAALSVAALLAFVSRTAFADGGAGRDSRSSIPQ
jgi:hypothetical protein